MNTRLLSFVSFQRYLTSIILGVLLAAIVTTTSAQPINAPPLHPKNIIVMVGDGMGFNQVAAAGFWQNNKTGEAVYESFPVRIGCSTYPFEGSYDPTAAWGEFGYVLKGSTDSAAAATALATGYKTLNGAIGVDAEGNSLKNIMELAAAQNFSTGVVTTVPLSHATPAGFSAHNNGRGNYADIANEMIWNSQLDVIIGAGHPKYDNDGKEIVAGDFNYVGGLETWKKILDGEAGNDEDGDGKIDYWTFTDSRWKFRKLSQGLAPRRLLGILPAASTAFEGRSGDANAAAFAVPFAANVPTLSESTAAALNVLDDNTLGFTLMIEGGAIDWASHSNLSGRMIEEMVSFNDAVQTVVDWVNTNSNWRDSLLIVTADHETGYPAGPGSGADGKAYWAPIAGAGIGQMPQVQWNSGGHSNSLVPLYAKGHGAYRFAYYIKGLDPVRGRYTDNTCVTQVIKDMLQKKN